MNLIERTFKEYLEVFHSTLSQSAKEYFPANLSHKLLHLSFLPAQIIGYVSTNFGVGFEYIPAKETNIKIVIGGKRIENLFSNPNKLLITSKTLFYLNSNIHMSGFNVDSGSYIPFILLNENSSVFLNGACLDTDARRKTVVYAELYGDSKVESWTRERAVIRAKNEVLAALTELNQSESKRISLDEYISIYKERTVLLLGDYDEAGLIRLQKIENTLKELNYEPLLIKDIPDHPHQDISQKVIAVGAVSRFVVVDDSSKSGHLSEIEICKQNRWVTILLRADGIGGTWMTAGASAYSNVIFEKSYCINALTKDLLEATSWAEKTIQKLEKQLSDIYPWRRTN